ncbi:MAG: putative rane protein [Gammaproteobacteria bacterium]|nr:putative rane protein [Gammaproteobacteria bacterium]
MASSEETLPNDNLATEPATGSVPAVVVSSGTAAVSPYILPTQLVFQLPGAPGAAARISQTITTQQVWQGPFPPPEAVAEYERVLPGCFNRLITMAEQAQTANTRSVERAQEFTRRDIRRGHILGAITTALAMVGCVVCVWLKQPWVAGLFLAVPVMAVARAFIEHRGSPENSPEKGKQSNEAEEE